MISVVVSRLKSLALSVDSSDKSALPPSDLTVTPTVLWLIPERQFAILDHKALETKTILKYLNLTTISYDLTKISNSWILNFLKNLYESSLFQAFCQWSVPRSQSAAEKKRGDGGGGGQRRKLSLSLPPLRCFSCSHLFALSPQSERLERDSTSRTNNIFSCPIKIYLIV